MISDTPSQIRMVEVYSGTVKMVDASTLPEKRRFVYLRQGKTVERRVDADETLPIVEVRSVTLDDKGNIVSPAKATKVRIEERGTHGRPLRWTLLRKAP